MKLLLLNQKKKKSRNNPNPIDILAGLLCVPAGFDVF